MNKYKKAFTLIELLVVIAIIALLLSIIAPSLNKVRELARAVIGLSNQKQFGTMYEMYTMNNDDNFPGGWNSGTMWMVDLLSYYGGAGDVRKCPSTKKFLHETGGEMGVYVAWGVHGHPDLWGGDVPLWSREGMYGSYGINGWAHNPPDTGVPGTYNISPTDSEKYWRKKTSVKNPSTVPLMADAMWDGTTPEPSDRPPDEYEYLDDPTKNSSGPDMWVYMVPRHQKKTQMLFVDLSAGKVGLKQLWYLNWHREWEVQEFDWPDWMNAFPE